MKRKSDLAGNIGRLCILFILFIVLFLCDSAAWLLEVFGSISFSTVLYQLSSPLKGTGHDILWNYIINCFVKSALEILCAGIVWDALRKLELVLEGRVLNRKFHICLKIKTMRGQLIVWGGIILMSVVSICRYAYLVGIPQYIDSISDSSTLYEEEYVSPASVKISFPEQKKNLIYIYMESMETTYASVDIGGGKDINYIPNLTELANENISFSDTDTEGGYNFICGFWMDFCSINSVYGRSSLWFANRGK